MSHFLSPRYLKIREAAARGPIADDLPCPYCGYNVRSLRYGQNCPECGQVIDPSRMQTDVLTSGGEDERRRWQTGLGIAAVCVGIAWLARLGAFGLGIGGVVPASRVYLWIGTANCVAWIVAVWLVTPPSLADAGPLVRRARIIARVLALAWLVGYFGVHLRLASPGGIRAPAWVYGIDGFGRLLGAAGVMVLAFMLAVLAERVELSQISRRFHTAACLLWLPSLLAMAFPATMAWFTAIPLAMVLFFWSWVMLLLLRGFFGLYRHVHWASTHVHVARERSARVERMRRELDEEASDRIRPLPED